MNIMRPFLVGLATTTLAVTTLAEELAIEAVMSPIDEMRLDFEDDSGRFVLLVQRQGKASGSGLLAGATATEYGMHDIQPGVNGNAGGYLVFEDADGDKAYLDWTLRAVFATDGAGNTTLLDNGFWEVAGGTGKHQGLKGAGTFHLEIINDTDRNYILSGELFPAN
ncbi:hypothetical protein [Halomonas sp. NO4]|uniref:hypothetical protein n=1 Tax=Halomonas sp. NO4 TaxID=2484813 RepID=UPI001969DEB3|nr:hypothetical protein [Halomonas sp. NO4]